MPRTFFDQVLLTEAPRRGSKWMKAASLIAHVVLVLAIFVLGYSAAWFAFNLGRMPPYIPGATTDPTFAPPQAVAWLAVVSGALVLPGSTLACWLAFRRRARMLRGTSPSRAST